MSGPPYPPSPETIQKNQIGSTFQVGVSPVGTIIPFSYWDTIISQYANSTVLTTLIGNFDQYIDQTFNFDQFYDLIWNVSTATGYGLDVWGRIVGVQRAVNVPAQRYFGFNEQQPTVEPFGPGGVGVFYSGTLSSNNFILSDQSFRQLIFAKALLNISSGSAASINQILLTLFPNRGNCYVQDNENMSITYVFTFALTPVEVSIVQTSGVLPKSTGVALTILTGPIFSPVILIDDKTLNQLTSENGIFILTA